MSDDFRGAGKIQRNKNTLVQSPLTTLGQEKEMVFYNAPEPTRGFELFTISIVSIISVCV